MGCSGGCVDDGERRCMIGAASSMAQHMNRIQREVAESSHASTSGEERADIYASVDELAAPERRGGFSPTKMGLRIIENR